MRRWHVLADLARQNKWRRGAEIGVYKGETFRYLLANCEGMRLIGVDRFDSAYFASTREGRPEKTFDLEAEYASLTEWVRRRARFRGRLLRMDTIEAAREVSDRSLDFVFIDADHRYEAVARDIAAWRGKVKPGGMLLGHDWNEEEFPGVIRAVREAFADRAIQTFDDHVWGIPC